MHILEITKRCSLAQGFLQPFLCRAEDNQVYYAKGSNSTVRGLISEWVAANLAAVFGLPTPDCHILYLDPALKSISATSWQCDLEFEYLFASRSVQPCETLAISQVSNIPRELQRDILIFDFWIQNADRHLGEEGGNVNLLLESASNRLQVIDFNLAFSEDFSLEEMDTHVFRKSVSLYPIDLACKSQYLSRMDDALKQLDLIISKIPDEWMEYSDSADTTLKNIRDVLERGIKDEFWGEMI